MPERGWLIAAVGLAGKVLGPIGLILSDRCWRLAPEDTRHRSHQRLHLVALLHAVSRRRVTGVPRRSRASLTMGLELAVLVGARVLEVLEAPASSILRCSGRMGNRGTQSATARMSLTSISSTSAGMTASRSATTVAFASLIVRRTPFASASGP